MSTPELKPCEAVEHLKAIRWAAEDIGDEGFKSYGRALEAAANYFERQSSALNAAREAIEQIKEMAINRVSPVMMPRRVQLGVFCQAALAQIDAVTKATV